MAPLTFRGFASEKRDFNLPLEIEIVIKADGYDGDTKCSKVL